MYKRQDLEKLADVLRGTNVMVISDEIYAELTYEGRHVSFASIPGMWERTITLNGFSKAFAMTGWRMGFACGPRDVMAVMCKIHQYTMLCAPTPGQYAALELSLIHIFCRTNMVMPLRVTATVNTCNTRISPSPPTQ